jgi:DNA-binding NarL/FixJ family response regulator
MCAVSEIRVLCVDDNEFIIEAMRRKLGRENGMIFAGFAESADDLIANVDKCGATLVLIDMNMPGKDPVDAIAELTKQRPHVKAVALSGYVREDMVDRVLVAGGCGYIAKDEDLNTITDSLRQVATGEIVFSPLVLKHYAGSSPSPN